MKGMGDTKQYDSTNNEKNKKSVSPATIDEDMANPAPFASQEQKSKEKQNDQEHDMLHLIPSLLDTSMIQGDIQDVACGNQHSLVLSSKGFVYSFGRNMEGQLGIGTRNRDVKAPTQITALSDDSTTFADDIWQPRREGRAGMKLLMVGDPDDSEDQDQDVSYFAMQGLQAC